MPTLSLLVPFTLIHETYKGVFTLYLNNVLSLVQTAVVGPVSVCVTLWVMVQGILIMRGDIDARRGLTKIVTFSLVIGLVTTSSLYQQYVYDLFETAIPAMVAQVGGNFGASDAYIPMELDAIFQLGQLGFQTVASQIPEMDTLDSLAFEGAQYFFYFTLWSIFGICDLTEILTSVLVSLGPLFIIGFLFDATKDITMKWVGQLVSYGILLLLTTIVAAMVVTTIAGTMAGTFLVAIVGSKLGAGSVAGKLVGLYELDMFIMTGNALVVALPAIAAQLGSGVGANGVQLGQGIMRLFADHKGPEGKMSKASDASIRDLTPLQ